MSKAENNEYKENSKTCHDNTYKAIPLCLVNKNFPVVMRAISGEGVVIAPPDNLTRSTVVQMDSGTRIS